jgi:hypothetical protein
MNSVKPQPGVSRENRLSPEGLERLEKQLSSGARMTDAVLKQWIIRYGDAARNILRSHGRYRSSFDQLPESTG